MLQEHSIFSLNEALIDSVAWFGYCDMIVPLLKSSESGGASMIKTAMDFILFQTVYYYDFLIRK